MATAARVLRRQTVKCLINSNNFQGRNQNIFLQQNWQNIFLQQNIRQLSSSFVSSGLVSQNVKQFSSSKSHETKEKFQEIKPYETQVVIREPENAKKNSPLVLLFGWGGKCDV